VQQPGAVRRDARVSGREEGGQEQQCLQRDDDPARGTVNKVADVGADEACRYPEGNAQDEQPPEAIGEQISGRARRDDHGDDETSTDGL